MSSKKFRNKVKPSTIVELVVDDAEYRLAEMKRKCVIYSRNSKFYVRERVEFYAKFEPVGDSA